MIKSTPLLLLALLTLTLPAGALQSYNIVPPQPGTLFRPVIEGDWIAWVQTRNPAAYAHNIKTGQTLRISEHLTTDDDVYPAVVAVEFSPWHPSIAISNNRVLYTERTDDPSRGSAVQLYDLTTNTRSRIDSLTSSTSHFDYPSLSEKFAAYAIVNSSFYIYDFAAQRRTRPLRASWVFPDLDGDHAVYSSYDGPGGNIMLRNLVTGQTTTLFDCNDNQNPRPPIVSGNLVAWSMRETTYGLGDVVKVLVADITTGQVTVVCENTYSPEHRSNVALSGRTVIWEDWRQNTDSTSRHNLDLYAYNLDSKIVFPVATNPGNQHLPDFSGRTVAFVQQFIPDADGGDLCYLTITLPGDFNGDGAIDALDVDPFTQALNDPAAYLADHPDIYFDALDLTGDAKIDVQDINPFLKLAGLTTAPPVLLALVPEPSTLLALTAGCIFFASRPSFRRKGSVL